MALPPKGFLSSSWRQSQKGMMPPAEAVASLLETVHYAQQLVLFAPHAVPAVDHVPLLRSKITSEQPALREAAARCLRHLAERDPGSLLPTGGGGPYLTSLLFLLASPSFPFPSLLSSHHLYSSAFSLPLLLVPIFQSDPLPSPYDAFYPSLRILIIQPPTLPEPPQFLVGVQRDLFAAIDAETDEKTLQQLQAALRALLQVGGPQSPIMWLHLLANVALASGQVLPPLRPPLHLRGAKL